MNQITELLSNGYSKQDILDLVIIFKGQLESFTSQLESFDSNTLSQEVHKLKGGCDLLYLNQLSAELSDYKNLGSSNLKDPSNLETLMATLNQLNLVTDELLIQLKTDGMK